MAALYEPLLSSAGLTGEGWGGWGCLLSTHGSAGGTLQWLAGSLQQELVGCLALFHLYRWHGWDPREHVLNWKPQVPVFPERKCLGSSSLRTVFNFLVLSYFHVIKLPPSHLHLRLFRSSPFSPAWYHNTISANELSSKHCIVAPLPTYFGKNKWQKMLWLLTQSLHSLTFLL